MQKFVCGIDGADDDPAMTRAQNQCIALIEKISMKPQAEKKRRPKEKQRANPPRANPSPELPESSAQFPDPSGNPTLELPVLSGNSAISTTADIHGDPVVSGKRKTRNACLGNKSKKRRVANDSDFVFY